MCKNLSLERGDSGKNFSVCRMFFIISFLCLITLRKIWLSLSTAGEIFDFGCLILE